MKCIIKAIFLFFIISVFSFSSLYAHDWSAEGLTENGTKAVNGESLLELTDAEGKKVFIQYSGGLDESTIGNVLEIRKVFLGWKNISADRVKFLVSGARMDIAVFPGTFTCGERDMLGYVSAGMQFIYTDSLEYNFRITLENLFIRVRGAYVDEASLCEKMLEAVKNPHDYIRKRDPEYILTRLDRLEERNDRLEKENRLLRNAVMAMHNSGFFRGTTPVSSEVVNRIVEMKKAKPSLTVKQIEEELEKEKIMASSKEISLVLAVYFNEY